jgi:hypothetical protein
MHPVEVAYGQRNVVAGEVGKGAEYLHVWGCEEARKQLKSLNFSPARYLGSSASALV